VFLFLTISSTSAEDPTFGTPHPFGDGSEATASVAVGDLDSDGDLDIIVGNSSYWDTNCLCWTGSQNTIHLNDGAGNLEVTRNLGSVLTNTTSVAVGDLDSDGDLDIVVGNDGGQNTVHLNDGSGNFGTAHDFGTGTDDTLSVAVGDADGNGSLDIAVGGSGQNTVYLNDGVGNFHTGAVNCGSPPTNVRCFGTGSDSTTSIALGDLNGDGYNDIAAGTFVTQNVVYLNDGSGNFGSSANFGTGSDITTAIAVGDMDGDGDLDIATGNSGNMFPGSGSQNVVYLNNGSGSFGATRNFGAGWDWTESLTLGDLDGDGSLDIVIGNSGPDEDDQNTVCLNDGSGNFSIQDLGPGTDNTTSMALGDFDSDGALDIVVANSQQYNVVYANDGAGEFDDRQSMMTGFADTVALGDMDADGNLDIVLGGSLWNGSNHWSILYLNDGAGSFPITRSFGAIDPRSMALGDIDGNNSLDVVAGGYDQSLIYLNDGAGNLYLGTVDCATPPTNAHCFGTGTDRAFGIVLGDVDGDSDLDIVAGNGGWATVQNVVYLNNGTGDFYSGSINCSAPPSNVRCFGTGADKTRGVAVGDIDGDGDLDIATANWGQPNYLYLNNGSGGFDIARQLGSASNRSYSVVMGDLNGDGFPDIAVGNDVQGNTLFFNDGGGLFDTTHTFGTLFDSTEDLALGDVDGDGDLDIFVGNGGQFETDEPSAVYLNDGAGNFAAARDLPPVWAADVSLGDFTNDGTLDLVEACSTGWIMEPSFYYFNHIRHPERLPNSPPYLTVDRPGAVPEAEGYSTPEILEGLTIPVPFTLFDPEGDPVSIEAFYSPDGGGRWLSAVPSNTLTSNLPASPSGTDYVFLWDTFASGLFGQSDNVVFRIEARPSFLPQTNGVPGPYQWPYASTTTYPFRVRGTQIQVLSATVPVEGAIVYRLPDGQTLGGALIADNAGRPFRTDAQGYLQGRGELRQGDQLVALLPIASSDTYTAYHTSAAPTTIGLDGHEIVAPGVQQITVSPSNPLVLFDLTVALEWDAHQDTAYLDQLEFNLHRASEYLYDFTNGQVGLGHVNVFQNADEWAYSNIVVHASNRLRPFANQGGIVISHTVDPQHNTISDTIVYGPGQVAIGSTWNRYGNPGQFLGEDWPIILAHELSHYLLFHDDTYLGLDENGFLVSVDTCIGSAMGDLYTNPDNTEFIADEVYWQANCADTLAEQTLGRNEWETMQLWYSALVTPTAINSGPATMPFDFTSVTIHDPYTPTNTLVDPTFYLDYEGGGGSSSEARAYLDRTDYVINLGSPFGGQNRIIARGARPGDRLCVFDRPRAQFGCEIIDIGDDRLTMRQDPYWNPIIRISPVNSTTLSINMTNTVPITAPVYARIFPDLGFGEPPIALSLSGGTYTGTFHLTNPAMSGNIQLWVDEPYSETDPRREAIVALSIGGNPGAFRAGGGAFRAGGGAFRAGGGAFRAGGGAFRAGGAPIVSPDGQMIFFTENPVDFITGTFFTIQSMAGMPPLPPGRTLIGQGYNLVSSPGFTLPVGSVSMQYLSNDVLVAGAEESNLNLYYWDGNDWDLLKTVLDTNVNLASAPSRGEGVYALMASVKIALYGPGWNLISYPVQTTQPVSVALLSISGHYTTVYGYDASDAADPWKVYDVTVPPWVNELEVLEYGQGYWINASQPITLHMSRMSDVGDSVSTGFPFPPSTFYGPISSTRRFMPAAGMTLTAWVEGTLCGQTIVTEVVGYGPAYAIDVLADDWSLSPGCGAPGREITFAVGSEPLIPAATWDNTRVQDFPLRPWHYLQLPLTLRRFAFAPDLVISRIRATTSTVTVTIANQGHGLATDDFWVDLYIDPNPPPTHVNQTWSMLSDQGLVWGVTADLQPGDILTLTVGGAYYYAPLSSVMWPVPPGTPVYVQVDSAGQGEWTESYGGVLENHEIIGAPYNNISAPKLVSRTIRGLGFTIGY
jgi:hypothetical protein